MISKEQEHRLYGEARPIWEEFLELSAGLAMTDSYDEELEKKTDDAYDRFTLCCREILGRDLTSIERYRYFPSYDD